MDVYDYKRKKLVYPREPKAKRLLFTGTSGVFPNLTDSYWRSRKLEVSTRLAKSI